jgi:hypothetical protein
MYQDIQPITEADAHAETNRLFDEPNTPITDLPDELIARGWKLITRAPDRLFAVSKQWGCTSTKTNIEDVITEAWGLVGFCEYVNRARAQGLEVDAE